MDNFNLLNFIALSIIILLFMSLSLMLFVIVLRSFKNYKQKKLQQFADYWEERIFEYLTGDISLEKIVSEVKRKNYYYLLEYLKSHLQALKDEDYERISALVTKSKIHDFLIHKLQSHSKRKNIKASYYLGLVRSKRAKELFIQKLSTTNDHLFSNCAIGLAKLKSVELIDKIFSESTKHNKVSVDTMLTILLEFGEDVCRYLDYYLQQNVPVDYKIIFIRTLSYYKNYSSGQSILQILINTDNHNLIIECIDALGKIKYTDALYALGDFLENKNAEIRAQAVKAIGRIGSNRFEENLLKKLKDVSWQVQYNSSEALYNISDSGKKKLEDIAYSLEQGTHSSIARMILAEKSLKRI